MTHQYSNLGKVKTLDGTVVDWLLKILNKLTNHPYLGVYNASQNEVSKGIIPDSRLSNSVELCIKDNSIVDFSTLNIII